MTVIALLCLPAGVFLWAIGAQSMLRSLAGRHGWWAFPAFMAGQLTWVTFMVVATLATVSRVGAL